MSQSSQTLKLSRFFQHGKLTFDFTAVITNQRLFSLTQLCQLMITELEPTQIWKQGLRIFVNIRNLLYQKYMLEKNRKL